MGGPQGPTQATGLQQPPPDHWYVWLAGHVDLAAIILIVLLAFAAWVVWKAQQREDFDFSKMLKDDSGKESGLRMSALGAFAVSSWAIMFLALHGHLTENMLLYYTGFWSGAKVFEKFVNSFVARRNGDGKEEHRPD